MTAGTSTRNLADFLNHGILPFVGRDEDLGRVLAFWKQTIDAEALRILLLVGEAGIGKSRLIEELIPRISLAGGAVIHAKLYPDSSTTITPLLVRSMWQSNAGRELLKKEPKDTREYLINGLRHISSLRPTIVFLEDLHLLSQEGIRELSSILESLTDDTISFCIASRPAMQQARTILERYLTTEIDLEGLDHQAFTRVCEQLFDATIDPETVRLIERVTLGNSLALRSALRGVLKSGYLARRTEIDRWQMTVPSEAFQRQLEHNVRSLSEGLAAHLQEDEQLACDRLAVLGELFSFEAASAFLTDPKSVLERLSFKGMLVPSNSVISPLAGAPSSYPLFAFSHTLLHKFFFERSSIDASELAKLMARDIPLYGIAPILKLSSVPPPLAASAEDLRNMIVKADEMAGELDGGSDWELAIIQGNAVLSIFRASHTRWGPREADLIEMHLMRNRLNLFRRQLLSTEYAEALARLYALTENPETAEIAEFRLVGCVYEYWYIDRQPRTMRDYTQLRAKVAAVLEAYGELRLSYPHTVFLGYEARRAANRHDLSALNAIEATALSILNDDAADRYVRETVVGTVLPHMLASVHTHAELEDRLELVRRIEAQPHWDTVNFPVRKMRLFASVGRYGEALEVLERAIPVYERQGMFFTSFQVRMSKAAIEVAMGRDPDEVLDGIQRMFAALPTESHERARYTIVKHLLPALVPIGRPELVMRVLEKYDCEHIDEIAESYVLHRLQAGTDPSDYLARCRRTEQMYDFLTSVRQPRTGQHVVIEACKALAPRLLLVSDLIDRMIIIEYLLRLDLLSRCRAEVAASIEAMLDWLSSTVSTGYARPVLERYRDLLSEQSAKSWKQRIAKLGREQPQDSASSAESDKVMLCMFGAIEIRRGSDSVRIRGARLRAVLGVMTANLMLSDPLDIREFRMIAAGERDDMDLARKSLNMAVAALREDLGTDAITTKGDTPSLDLERIRIDVVEASDLLDDALRSLRRGSLARALQEVSAAYEIALGKVPFPTLYDSLFEALRDDLDARLRKVTVELAKRLIAQEDLLGAAGLLRRFFDALPEDAEVAALLRDCLQRSGRIVEAERVNIRNTIGAEAP